MIVIYQKLMLFHPHTVFAFNTALIKDIALSYEDLEKSIKTVYQSFENSE